MVLKSLLSLNSLSLTHSHDIWRPAHYSHPTSPPLPWGEKHTHTPAFTFSRRAAQIATSAHVCSPSELKYHHLEASDAKGESMQGKSICLYVFIVLFIACTSSFFNLMSF